ncbi:ATP-dependent zinc protease [Engelhardtia mirabilis]|uniref:Retropepsin-like aspartic endopeptidase domain-containing protein n=1 Tax=Engelhardtia mirabilis TaxID=2528011 RepID=A0A518BDV0_9BACT|nr:hypothetical protein Pla133_02210 [Planctomycetes bacterium Pla133]QDU99483.1 hypothetical protein Pla86_02210 [Planctomycetes bacterium Pla86]
MSKSIKREPRVVVGWREWVALPDLGVETIKAKVDTGARTSSLHAFNVVEFQRDGQDMVRFAIHPEQGRKRPEIQTEAPLLERRKVTPSSGHAELRPVVSTHIELLGRVFEVELTLTRRDAMGFRMLLGRQALRGRFVVDPGRSFLNGRRIKGTKRLKSSRPPAGDSTPSS